MKEKVESLVVKFNEVKKTFMEEVKENFNQFTKEIFERHPVLTEFRWNQYTPYFNDGDTCEFSANVDYLYVNGEHEDELKCLDEKNIVEYGRWDRNLGEYIGRVEEPNPEYNKELAIAVIEVKEMLKLIPKELYLNMFGDHVEVIVTKEGIEVEEYNHD